MTATPRSDDNTHAGFSERDEVVLDALALGRTHAEAASLIGVGPKFVQRRLGDESFKAEARRRRSVQLDAVAGQLAAIGPRAVAVLLEEMDAASGGAARVRAAVAVLTTLNRVATAADLDRRLADLEAKAAQMARPRRSGRR